MKFLKKRPSGSVIATAVAAAFFSTGSVIVVAQDVEPTNSRLEEVVVTARKISENIQDVPISVTAIGALTPLAFWGGALYAPLAVIIIGGLISSTLLSRVVTPAMYLLVAMRDEASDDTSSGGIAASA